MKRLLIILLLLIWPAQAWPYIPTVDELLTDLSAKRVHLTSLEAVYDFPAAQGKEEDSLTVHDRNESLDSIEPFSLNTACEKVSFRAPDRIRVNIAWPDREEVFLAVGVKTLALFGEQAQETPWPQPFLLFRLLIDSEATRLRELLSAFNFNLQKITLGRHHGMIVYILGARAGDLSQPQAWFERESLRLTRLILPPGRNTPGYDIELSDYRLHEQRVDWPDVLVSRLNNGPPLTIKLNTLSINLTTEADLSEQEGSNQAETPEFNPEETLAKDPDVIRIRKMMERLRKKLE
ncbi:MAG: hypothetical protein JRG97_07205 [Deltaproteobacteria bacterium]|nr:hypothetical protein [Deltaproteobacteria bacterium]MBW2052362.1 hypothetical protein [Deltaproteobacteria bacterium]MBW2140845.1 hypothetical protein [Deltaproteobacteria bacterium]MBW2323989.1 hypothetical protein [Deltaproteobacteria bacterium]